MSFDATDGSQPAPMTLIQTNGVVAIPAEVLPAGTMVRNVTDGTVSVVSPNYNSANNALVPFVVSNNTKVGVSTNVAPLTITTTDGIGLVVATGTAHPVTLPAVASSKGRMIRVVSPTSTAQNITIDPAGAELINGAASFVMKVDYQIATVVCDGAAWYANVGDPTP